MFNWIKSPQLPDTIETQSFRAVSGHGPILKINSLNDRTHSCKLIPWEDILEVFPNAVYIMNASGIVMPARDSAHRRITPKSIRLQPDVVLQVVSGQDLPPASTIPENIEKIEKLPVTGSGISTLADSLASTSLSSSTASATVSQRQRQQSRSSISSASTTRASTESHAPSQTRLSSSSRTSNPEKISTSSATKDADWSPFQANNPSTFEVPSTSTPATVDQLEILRQELTHRMELLSAEQEERLQILLRACQRPGR